LLQPWLQLNKEHPESTNLTKAKIWSGIQIRISGLIRINPDAHVCRIAPIIIIIIYFAHKVNKNRVHKAINIEQSEPDSKAQHEA